MVSNPSTPRDSHQTIINQLKSGSDEVIGGSEDMVKSKSKLTKAKSGPDNRTLAEIEGQGLSASAWRARKFHYRRSGLKSGEWHLIRPNNLDMKLLRCGMVIENKMHGNRYVIIQTNAFTTDRFQRPCIIVVPPEHEYMDYQVRKLYATSIVDVSRFKLVIR
jgi:hypothetical protein